MTFTDLTLLTLDIAGSTATAGYLASAVMLLALAGVVVIAVRRWLRSPKE